MRAYILHAAAAGCGETLDVALEMADLVAPVKREDSLGLDRAAEAALAALRDGSPSHVPQGISPAVALIYEGLNRNPEVDDTL